MPRQSQKKKADKVKDLFLKANCYERTKWESGAQTSYEFFLGDQLSKEEIRILQESGMPDFVVNRITPVIEMMKYFATANNPRWQAVGAEGSDADVAAMHSDIAEYCWHNSNGDSIFSHIIQDSLVKGIGYMQIDVDPDQDRGLGEVVYKRIDPFDVFVDPTSRDFLFRDANYIMIRKDLPKSQLIDLFPSKKAMIKNASGNSTGVTSYSGRDINQSDVVFPTDIRGPAYKEDGEEDEFLDYYEVYSKEKVSYYNLYINIPPSPHQMEEIRAQVQEQLSDMQKEMFVKIEETAISLQSQVEKGEMIESRAALELEKAQKQMQSELENQRQVLESGMQEERTRVKNYVVTEAEFKEIQLQDLTKDNIVDAIQFFETRIKVCIVAGDKLLFDEMLPVKEYPIVPFVYQYTGTPYPLGAVQPMVGKQRELNKAHQILIHNANLASNLRWLYEEGSVPEEEWEQYSSSPGALLKYRQGFTPPTPVQPAPLNSAFFGITETAREDMEYISGIYSSMQGSGKDSQDTYRGLLAQDEYGTRRIKSWMQNVIEPALEHLGVIFKDLSQATYQANKVFRIVQPNNINEEKVMEINIPIYNDFGETIEKFNDYGTAKFDVRIIGGSTLPLNRWALLEEYFKWYQSGLIDDIAMLQETDVRNKESIIERKSIYMQLRSRVEELEGMMVDREGTIETLERQVVQANIQSQVQKAEGRIDKSVSQTEAQQVALRDKLRSDTAFKVKEMDLKQKQSIEKLDKNK
jgi:hypothetical protein